MKNIFCYLFSHIAEAVILWQYTSGLFIARYTKKLRLTVLILCHFLLFMVFLFEKKWLNAILVNIMIFLFIATQHKLKWYLALFHASILTAFMAISELILYGTLAFFRNDYFSEDNYFYNLFLLASFSKIIYFFITYLLMNFLRKKEKKRENGNIASILLSLVPIMSIFIVIVFINIGENITLPTHLNRMIAISAIFLLTINLLVFGMHQYTQKKSLEFTQMQLLLQKESNSSEYYKMLLSQKENQNILIHDIKKHLQSIALLNDKGEPEKINTYIHQLLHSSNLKETVRFCDQDLLNAVLYRYQRRCQEENIDFHADIRSQTTTFLADYDLTSLFGNLLDNALEAAREVSHAYIEISACRKENAPFVVVTMVNSCLSDPFSQTSGRLISQKSNPEKHGFGIKSIQKIVSRYGGDMQMYYQDETHTFHTVLTLHRIP